jgi:hypothetical protein
MLKTAYKTTKQHKRKNRKKEQLVEVEVLHAKTPWSRQCSVEGAAGRLEERPTCLQVGEEVEPSLSDAEEGPFQWRTQKKI